MLEPQNGGLVKIGSTAGASTLATSVRTFQSTREISSGQSGSASMRDQESKISGQGSRIGPPVCVPVTSVACSMWDPTQFAIALADGSVRQYTMQVHAPGAAGVDAVVHRTAKQERAAVKERARSRKLQKQAQSSSSAATGILIGGASAPGEASDIPGAEVATSLAGNARLPASLDIAMELQVTKGFEAQLPWSGDGLLEDVSDQASGGMASGTGSS